MVFVKKGFGTLIDQLGILKYLDMKKREIDKEGNTEIKYSRGERFRSALEELGPTFIKLGQIISTRPDLLPQDIICELEKLHDAVPPFSFEEVKSRIENELGEKLENIFISFDEKPLAAASIGQVHLAKLKEEQSVVVKVQRPGIERKIEQDIRILKDLAWFIDHHTKYGKLYDFTKMIKEFEYTLKNELDFKVEGENAEIFKKNFLTDKQIVIPSIYWSYSTRGILTMEYIDGISLNDMETLKKEKIDFELIARKIAKSILEQILEDGFFHADPHPGNVMILPNNRIVFLDFGMIGKLKEQRKVQFLKILLGIAFRNSKLIVKAIISLDAMTKRSDIKKLEKEIDKLIDHHIDLSLKDIKLGEIFSEIFNLAFKYSIKIPSEFTMLVKTLATTEGIIERLAPELSIIEIAKPIAKKLMFKIFSAEKITKDIIEGALDYSELIKDFPSVMNNFLKKMEDEEFTFSFEIKNIDKILKHFDKISNKISFSIALLALSLIIAGLIIGFGIAANSATELYMFNLSVLKYGLIIAVLMALWLIFSIFKTGRF
ncbi:2-octaprenylphenol hydroxylase [Lutibacter sp. B2]|nr:2-octaprenylphenol hydroxylase [Lutibacter sp. B2]